MKPNDSAQQRRPRREPFCHEEPGSRPPSAAAICSALAGLGSADYFDSSLKDLKNRSPSSPDTTCFGPSTDTLYSRFCTTYQDARDCFPSGRSSSSACPRAFPSLISLSSTTFPFRLFASLMACSFSSLNSCSMGLFLSHSSL